MSSRVRRAPSGVFLAPLPGPRLPSRMTVLLSTGQRAVLDSLLTVLPGGAGVGAGLDADQLFTFV
ncbi:hypothetical protein [Streptomyces sp. NPDC056105]|uniref:hypothetical protein n=1 Tax=Streptomyces sp. NPDC056105 TaxID=3345714 RepID=UPI0035D83D18